MAELASRDIPVWQYELSVLRNRQLEKFLPQVCPIFETRYSQGFPHAIRNKGSVEGKNNKLITLGDSKLFSSSEKFTVIVPPSKIYLREREIMPTLKHHRTIFIWVANSSISDVIRILDESILWCEQAWTEIPFIE